MGRKACEAGDRRRAASRTSYQKGREARVTASGASHMAGAVITNRIASESLAEASGGTRREAQQGQPARVPSGNRLPRAAGQMLKPSSLQAEQRRIRPSIATRGRLGERSDQPGRPHRSAPSKSRRAEPNTCARRPAKTRPAQLGPRSPRGITHERRSEPPHRRHNRSRCANRALVVPFKEWHERGIPHRKGERCRQAQKANERLHPGESGNARPESESKVVGVC